MKKRIMAVAFAAVLSLNLCGMAAAEEETGSLPTESELEILVPEDTSENPVQEEMPEDDFPEEETPAPPASVMAAAPVAERQITVENNTVYANGVPIVIQAGDGGMIYVYDTDGETKLYDQAITSPTIYGGGKNMDVEGDTYVEIRDVRVSRVFGGGYSDGTGSANVSGNTEIIVTGSKAVVTYGGGYAEGKKDAAQANVFGKAVTRNLSRVVPQSAATSYNPVGGGYAFAAAYSASADVGDVEMTVGGPVYVIHGGGYASSSSGQSAVADCETISITVEDGDVREIYAGGYANGAETQANAGTVSVEVFRSELMWLTSGGSASEGGSANVSGKAIAYLKDCPNLYGYFIGGGQASSGASATVGSVDMTLENCVIPVDTQWGDLVSAGIYAGGTASGANSCADTGDIRLRVLGGECAGSFYIGGEASGGGSAACGNASAEFSGVAGNEYEDNNHPLDLYGAFVACGGEKSGDGDISVKSVAFTVKSSFLGTLCGGPIIEGEPAEPTFPSKILLGDNVEIEKQACLNEIELLEDLQSTVLPNLAQGEKLTIRGGGHSIAVGLISGGTLTVEQVVFQGKPLCWTGTAKESLTVSGCTFESVQAPALGQGAINAEANGGSVLLKNNTFQNITAPGEAAVSPIWVNHCGALTVMGNRIQGWTGYAMDLNCDSAAAVTVTGNAMEDPPAGAAAYLRLSGVEGVALDLRKNYWSGKDPAAGQLAELSGTPASCELTPYFLAASMRDPQDLSNYAAPPSQEGGGSSSGSSSGSSGSSSGASSTTTETGKNNDGSTTTITTNKKTGIVTETVKTTTGVTGTVVTDSSGKVAEVFAAIPAKAAKEAAETGGTVTLPVKVPVAAAAAEAPAVKVSVSKTSGAVKVEIPVTDVTPGTVAVIVSANGTEQIVQTSVVTEAGVLLVLNADATIKIVDNSKDFADVPQTYWAADAVDYVSSRELFNGTSAETFTPAAPMTRAMLMTVLARLDGQDTSEAPFQKGMAWAVETGVSDGSDPNGTISRQQLAVMLYRYAGSPAAEGRLDFADADGVSGYAAEAMRWAVDGGILAGRTNETLDPQGTATRAQVATMLMRLGKYLTQ